jgi:hypothetical protein
MINLVCIQNMIGHHRNWILPSHWKISMKVSDADLSKALFYAGRTGGQCTDIFLISICAHLGIHWTSVVTLRLGIASWKRITFELIVLPVFLYILIWKPSIWFYLLAVPLLFEHSDRMSDEGRDEPLAMSRLTTLLLTTISIIFVDFPEFPQGHAKVSHHLLLFRNSIEKGDLTSFDDPWNKGKVHLSLMDCGASYFLILNGFSTLAVSKCLISGSINIALWGTRIFLTQSANYFTPEGEYSTNCNFFGYVGAVQIIAAVAVIVRFPSRMLGFIVIVIHELTGNSIPFLGYLGLFFLANAIGYRIPLEPNYFVQLAFWLLPTLLAELEIIHPLRETANAAFSLFCFSNFYFTLVLARRYKLKYSDMSTLYKAIDGYPLIFFLGANVATGVINLAIDANHSSLCASFISSVIVFYAASAITLAASFLLGKRSQEPKTTISRQ